MAFVSVSDDIESPPFEAVRNSHIYERHLESNILRNAIGSGYLNSLTVEELLGQSQQKIKKNKQENALYCDGLIDDKQQNYKQNAVEDIILLNLNSLRLRIIKAIGVCLNLTVCNISCNFIEKIDALRSCRCLRKLDLHQNQIVDLPDDHFWHELENLQVLYMHDNGLSTFDEVKKISASQNLLILTMYDTPISLKMYYRHFVANSIWSLKALDHAVLSDEEIIEDAKFSKRFQALQPQFFFKPHSLEIQDSFDVDNEIKAIEKDIAVVNKIQAKFCPVLIIQRFIRGFIARRRFQYEQDKRLWAAVTIQRFYRDYRGIEIAKDSRIIDDFSYLSASSQRLDYDTYIKYRRSRDRSFASTAVMPSMFYEHSKASKIEQNFNNSNGKMKLYVNLKGLEASTSKIIDDKWEDDILHEEGETKFWFDRKSRHRMASGTESKTIDIAKLSECVGMNLIDPNKTKRTRPLKMSKAAGDINWNRKDKGNDEIVDGDIPFRLLGVPAPEMKCDLIEDLTKCIVEGARDIRDTIREFKENESRIPKRVVQKRYPMTVDQKLFIRTHGTMSLSCFHAVDQAYKDRDSAKNLSTKMQQIQIKKQRRDVEAKIREHKKYLTLEKIQVVKNEEKNDLMQAMDEQRADILARQEIVALVRNKRERKKEEWKQSHAFAVEFSCQTNAISKALASHAGIGTKGKIVEMKRAKTKKIKEDASRQKEIIKRYNEHRNLLLQSEASLSKSKLESDLQRRSFELKKEARLRVKKMKKTTLHKKIALPAITTAPLRLPPLAVVTAAQMEVWEKLPKKELKTREHDRINIWLS